MLLLECVNKFEEAEFYTLTIRNYVNYVNYFVCMSDEMCEDLDTHPVFLC